MTTRRRKKKEEGTRKEAEAEEFLDERRVSDGQERFWIQEPSPEENLLRGEYKGFPGRAMLELELKKREDRKKRSRSHREKKK